jgi:hypothetical protein
MSAFACSWGPFWCIGEQKSSILLPALQAGPGGIAVANLTQGRFAVSIYAARRDRLAGVHFRAALSQLYFLFLSYTPSLSHACRLQTVKI